MLPPSRSAMVSIAMPTATAASASSDGRSVKPQAGSRVQRAAADPLDDQAGAVQRGADREPPVGPRDGAVVPARAEPQAHRRRAPRQHAKHGHPRRSEMIRRTRAPSVPPRCSEVLNARRAKADSLVTLSLPRRNEKSPSPGRSVRLRPPSPSPKYGLATGLVLTLRTRDHTSVEEGRPAGDNLAAAPDPRVFAVVHCAHQPYLPVITPMTGFTDSRAMLTLCQHGSMFSLT